MTGRLVSVSSLSASANFKLRIYSAGVMVKCFFQQRKKFVLNVGINQTQAMFSADYGMVQRDEKLLTYCRKLMEEAVAVANAEGVTETENMISAAMDVILSMPGNVKTSMLQDMLARHKSEVDAFAGTICAKAEKYGIPVPCNREVLSEITSRSADFS